MKRNGLCTDDTLRRLVCQNRQIKESGRLIPQNRGIKKSRTPFSGNPALRYVEVSPKIGENSDLTIAWRFSPILAKTQA